MVEFKINNYQDRRSLVAILANAGYVVKVREEDRFPHSNDMFVQVLDVEESPSVTNNITLKCDIAEFDYDTFIKQVNEQLKKNIYKYKTNMM